MVGWCVVNGLKIIHKIVSSRGRKWQQCGELELHTDIGGYSRM